MENGRLKPGIQSTLARQLGFERKTISRQWRQMQRVLAPLLSNQNIENHASIIKQNAHKLFATGHSSKKLGKVKYDNEELLAMIKLIPTKGTTLHPRLVFSD
jgi:hypothetical protein